MPRRAARCMRAGARRPRWRRRVAPDVCRVLPFDDISLDISGGWDAPTHIRAWAYTELWADEDGPAPFLFTTCGGAAVWLNGEKVLEFTPFTRNIPADTPLELTLRKGRNSVLVFFDDLAERDAAFLLRLCWQGTDAPPEQRVPVGAANPTLLEQGEQAMRSLCFSRNHYAAGPVSLRCENPFAQQTLHVTLEGATEENEQAGVLFTRTADFAPGQTRRPWGTAPSSRSDFFCCRPPLWWRE